MTIHSRGFELLEPMAPLKEITSFEQSNLLFTLFTLFHEKETFFNDTG